MLIGRFRESHRDALQPRLGLAVRLKDLVDRIERRWGLAVEWSAMDLEAVPDALADEIYLAVYEGLMNAARHAGASVITLNVRLEDCQVKVSITDNGRGFRLKGRFDQAALARLKVGPATLTERAAALNGTLTLDSTERGTRLDLTLPVDAGVR
jgi:two-component system NarL family sensor kinase